MPVKKTALFRRKKSLFAAFIAACVFFSPETADAEEKNAGAAASSSVLGLQISSVPEIKATFTQSFTFPMLRGSGPLTQGNNLKTAFTAEVTPISVNASALLTLTPIAFFELSAGGKAGTGWNIDLFGQDIYGIGINSPKGDAVPAGQPRKSEVLGNAFDGLLWSAWAGGALQFDLAAVFPGDWNHVLFRTYHDAKYAAYTQADEEDSWFFEFDYGENRNGWTYNSSYVLGYQMPLSPLLKTVAFMAEMRKNLYDSPNGDFWGDSLGQWTLSGMANFSVTPALDITLAIQFHTRRNHGSSDLENKGLLFYQDMELRESYGARRLLFYRAAVLLNYKLR